MIGKTNATLEITSEMVNLTLQTNQNDHNDLLGTEITVTYADVINTYIWEGRELLIKIPKYAKYTITFESVEGYKTPDSFSSVAQEKNSISLKAEYKTELVTIEAKDNNGNIINNATFTINGNTYNDPTKIAHGSSYTIQALPLEGYGTPENITYIASEQNKLITVIYNFAEIVTINVSGAEGFTITIETEDGQIIAQQTTKTAEYSIPYGTTYIVKASTISGYTIAESSEQTFQASGPSRVVTITYIQQTQHVIVYSSTNDGTPVENLYSMFRVELSNGEELVYTLRSVVEFDIPIGIEYTVILSDERNYKTPPSQTFIANSTTETQIINMQYQTMKLGVYVQGVSGQLYTEWDNQEAPNGIAVISDNCNFVMALSCQINKSWGPYSVIPNIATTQEISEAVLDYKGQHNTRQIISEIASSQTDYSAQYCSNFTFPNGKKGYLGAAGEWQAVFDNLDKITELLDLCGGDYTDYESAWSSTQAGYSTAWGLRWDTGIRTYPKNNVPNTRPFTTLYEDLTTEDPEENIVSINWSTISGTWNSSQYDQSKDGQKWTCVSPGTDGSTVLRCTFSGLTSITFNCISNGEENYDYLTIGSLDTNCTRDDYNITLEGTANVAQDITFTCDTGEHYVEFCYSKDYSVDQDSDNATVYITSYN